MTISNPSSRIIDFHQGIDDETLIREMSGHMQRFARWQSKSRSIRDTAMGILDRANIQPGDEVGEVYAIQSWVHDNIKFVDDPHDIELIRTPTRCLIDAVGDCDDHSTLVASLLKSIDKPASYFFVDTRRDGVYSHVFTATKIRDRAQYQRAKTHWIPLETTAKKPIPFGWVPPHTIFSSYEV